jgi:hypothetical protein
MTLTSIYTASSWKQYKIGRNSQAKTSPDTLTRYIQTPLQTANPMPESWRQFLRSENEKAPKTGAD